MEALTFTTLYKACEMANLSNKFNLMGIVVGVGLRNQSSGPDYVYTLQIVDYTYFQYALSINFFAPTVEQLPYVNSFGDILVIAGAKINYKDSLPCISYPKSQFSYALFDRNPIDGQTDPYFSCISSGYDLNKIQQFRIGGSNFQFGPGPVNWMRKISDIENNLIMDLICKVLHVQNKTGNLWELVVCDGTSAPQEMNLETVQSYAARMQLPTPSMGSILKVYVSCISFDEHLIIGRCVKLTNVICKVDSSVWCGYLHTNSKIRFLSEDTTSAQHLRCINKRMLSISDAPIMRLPNTEEVSHDGEHGVPDNTNPPRIRNPERKSYGPSKRERLRKARQRERKRLQNEALQLIGKG